MSQQPLQLFVDLGSSVTKILYAYQGKVALMLMPPETANVTPARVTEFIDVTVFVY